MIKLIEGFPQENCSETSHNTRNNDEWVWKNREKEVKKAKYGEKHPFFPILKRPVYWWYLRNWSDVVPLCIRALAMTVAVWHTETRIESFVCFRMSMSLLLLRIRNCRCSSMLKSPPRIVTRRSRRFFFISSTSLCLNKNNLIVNRYEMNRAIFFLTLFWQKVHFLSKLCVFKV